MIPHRMTSISPVIMPLVEKVFVDSPSQIFVSHSSRVPTPQTRIPASTAVDPDPEARGQQQKLATVVTRKLRCSGCPGTARHAQQPNERKTPSRVREDGHAGRAPRMCGFVCAAHKGCMTVSCAIVIQELMADYLFLGWRTLRDRLAESECAPRSTRFWWTPFARLTAGGRYLPHAILPGAGQALAGTSVQPPHTRTNCYLEKHVNTTSGVARCDSCPGAHQPAVREAAVLREDA